VESVAQVLVFLEFVGIKSVVIHGGGKEISAAMEKLGKKPEFVEGLRVTDRETMDIVEMVIGKTNNTLVSAINKKCGQAIGISGKSGNLFETTKQKTKVDLGFVGEITKVNSHIIETQLKNGYIPVISPIGIGADGCSYNINADTAAAELACALKASKFILLTNVEGVLDRGGKLIQRLSLSHVQSLVKSDVVSGGMIPKLKACVRAIEGGVSKAHIVKASRHALLEEILTREGTGTMIKKSI
jgi:acetylglutamate kinase